MTRPGVEPGHRSGSLAQRPLALFTAWEYHAFVNDRDLPLPAVEADHRRHAVVEQTIAELKSA